MLLRSLNLRRLSYVILSAEKNHFLTQLPSIQEKLVDTLRNVSAPIVQSEVFLCVRVLLCRLSPHNLSSFWPVILTELVSFSLSSKTDHVDHHHLVSHIRPDLRQHPCRWLRGAWSHPLRMQTP